MDLHVDEEKKEGCITGEAVEELALAMEDDEDCELQELPDELMKYLGEKREYTTEQELQDALVAAGLADLPIILVGGRALLKMPSEQHNKFTTKYVQNFLRWSKNSWGMCTGTHKIHMPAGNSRDPDISYWGYPRCVKEDGDLVPADFGSVPDVVVQFSWKNKKGYEEEAIDDMMTKSLEKDNSTRNSSLPRLGYLIKVRFKKKRRLVNAVRGNYTQDMEGLDIYRLESNTTVADAYDASNCRARTWSYKPGDEESYIEIRPQDLGITGFQAWLCGTYRISVSKIFLRMEEYHKERQKDGLATELFVLQGTSSVLSQQCKQRSRVSRVIVGVSLL